jgi:catechol 2,3-dioxygenase-like lactoylglutathione lyase family enzyme
MELCGVCIFTNDAPRLAAFYEIVLSEAPVVEGQHYGFDNAQLAVYNPGNGTVVHDKNMSLMYFVSDVTLEYERLLKEIPDICIASPPERRPWGAFSFWFLDPDGNTVSFIEKSNDER